MIDNPFVVTEGSKPKQSPRWIPQMLQDSKYLVCALRSWHQLTSIGRYTYDFWEFESSPSSHALIVHAIADWRDEDDQTEGLTLSLDEVEIDVNNDGVTLVEPELSGFEDVHKRSSTWTKKLDTSSG